MIFGDGCGGGGGGGLGTSRPTLVGDGEAEAGGRASLPLGRAYGGLGLFLGVG